MWVYKMLQISAITAMKDICLVDLKRFQPLQ